MAALTETLAPLLPAGLAAALKQAAVVHLLSWPCPVQDHAHASSAVEEAAAHAHAWQLLYSRLACRQRHAGLACMHDGSRRHLCPRCCRTQKARACSARACTCSGIFQAITVLTATGEGSRAAAEQYSVHLGIALNAGGHSFSTCVARMV